MDRVREELETRVKLEDLAALETLQHWYQSQGLNPAEELIKVGPPPSHPYLIILETEMTKKVDQRRTLRHRLRSFSSYTSDSYQQILDEIRELELVTGLLWQQANNIRKFLGWERLPSSDRTQRRHHYSDPVAQDIGACECHEGYTLLKEQLAELEAGKTPEWYTPEIIAQQIVVIREALENILIIRQRLGYEFPPDQRY